MSKRGNNEGSIYKRKDGRYAAALTFQGGKRRTLYAKTRQEVSRKLTAAMRDREAGLPVPSERQSVRQFLNGWLATIRSSVRESTFVRYEEYVRLYAVPRIGNVRMSQLTPQHLQELYAQKLAEGCSSTSVRHLHAVLHRALGQAVKWGSVPRNVAQVVDAPRRARAEFRALTPEEAKRFLEAARQDPLEALYVLALTTGMRQGELLALRWRTLILSKAHARSRPPCNRTASLQSLRRLKVGVT